MMNGIKKTILTLIMLFGASTLLNAQYIRHPEPQSGTPAFTDFYPADTFNMGQDLKRKGRTLLITGGALSLTGIAMYASAFTMISDSTDIGSYFSISGIALFASAIPFYAIGTNYCIKGKKTSFSASPGRLALMF